MPKIKKADGSVQEYAYTTEGIAAAEKAKAAGGQMVSKKKRKKSRGK